MRDTPDIFPDDGNFLLVYVTAPDKAVADRIKTIESWSKK